MKSSIVEVVKQFLRKYSLGDKTIIVGFSGGYDSMCLLNILSELRDEYEFVNLRLIAAHYNHNWRGVESKKEQEVCRLFSSFKNIEFYTADAPQDLKKTENSARIARYEFFDEALEQFDADAVFTAHNKDDNAETVLYRIIKGTGIVGLRGISEKRRYFYRPLLNVPRSEILSYCEAKNLMPNTDSSNQNIKYRRNYIRLNVIPSLEKINENVKDALNTLAQNASNDNQIIEEYLSALRPKIYYGGKIVSSEYKKLSEAVKKRILYEFVQELDLDYDYKKITELYNFIEANADKKNGSTISVSSSLWIYADDKTIEPIPPRISSSLTNDIVVVNSEGEYKIGDKKFILKQYDISESYFPFPPSDSNRAYVDLSKASNPLYIRTRRDGDIISPFGMSGTMKLKKYMNAKGVQKHNRDEIVLLCDENEVLWVTGVGLSSKIGVNTIPTHVIEIQDL